MKALLLNLVFTALLFTSFATHAVLFRLPLSSDTAVHYYYDHNSSSGIQDWKCGAETYNGHRGTDFSGGPRGRAIFAAAVGTLEAKMDTFGDGFPGNNDAGGAGNYVRLAHSDGFKTYYFHMTIGSVTTKAVGSAIACGEQIGGVGNSGNTSATSPTTGLHLHFEPRLNGVADDPFSGACGGPISWWVNQGSGSPSTACEGGVGPPTPQSPGTSTDTGYPVANLTPTFSWTGVTGASRYGLYVSREPYGSANIIYSVTTLTGTSHPIPGSYLLNSTKYRWNMTSFNSSGVESGVSATTLYFKTPAAPQKAINPNPPAGSVNQPINVDVTWNNGGGATSYNVYFGTDSTPDSGELRGNQTVTSFDPGTLAYNTTFYWRIDAVNTAGTTTGDVWNFRTAPPPPPQKAINPNPPAGSGDQSINVDVSWSDGGDATSYDVYFGIDSSPDSGELKGNQTGTSYDPGTLAYDTTYYWRIDAVNTAGTTTGDIWSFTTTPNSSSAPTINNPKLVGTTFTLSVPTQVGFNYTLEYKNSFSDANWTAVQTLGGTGGTITLTDTGATGSRRLYRVRVQ